MTPSFAELLANPYAFRILEAVFGRDFNIFCRGQYCFALSLEKI